MKMWALWLTQSRTGTPRGSRRAVGVIIAATVLADLVGQGRLRIEGDFPQPVPAGTDAASSLPPAADRESMIRSGAAGVPAGTGYVATPARIAQLAGQRAVAAVGGPQTGQQLDGFSQEILRSIAQTPGLTTGEVIEALADEIRLRLTRHLVKSGAARAKVYHVKNRPPRMFAVPPTGVAAQSPLIKLLRREHLAVDERFLLHLLANSSLARDLSGHVSESSANEALGPLDEVGDRYRTLLIVAITLLRDTAPRPKLAVSHGPRP
jgi:hypothetical protein